MTLHELPKKRAHGREMASITDVQEMYKAPSYVPASDYLSQKKSEKEDGREETHVPALSVNEQVLLMTCKVKVTAADGSSTLARALIDPGSSALFVHERLAQHLCLPRHSCWSQYTYTRFRMVPGVWRRGRCRQSWGRSICTEKITKDLPLHPILVTLKWDHLTDLKFATLEQDVLRELMG